MGPGQKQEQNFQAYRVCQTNQIQQESKLSKRGKFGPVRKQNESLQNFDPLATTAATFGGDARGVSLPRTNKEIHKLPRILVTVTRASGHTVIKSHEVKRAAYEWISSSWMNSTCAKMPGVLSLGLTETWSTVSLAFSASGSCTGSRERA